MISAALHVREDAVTPEEIQPYLSKDVVLSPEDEAALTKNGSRPITGPSLSQPAAQPNTAETEAFAALHRKEPGQGFSVKTEDEVRRKREELLQKLRKKKGSG